VDRSQFKKTLLVEDEGITRSALKALLTQCDPLLEIDVAGTYSACIDRLATRQYDLLFLDFNLGGQETGLDVLKWIQLEEIALHAVMLSAQDDRTTVLSCIDEGASGFISKKSDGDDNIFKTALDTILKGQIYLPSTAMGRGGFRPTSMSNLAPAVTLDSLKLKASLTRTLHYLLQGLSNKGIASNMHLAEDTIREYVTELLRTFGVRRRTELIVEMARRGIILPRAKD
jgi:two-component system nitrate/nitrite response regulator NarL